MSTHNALCPVTFSSHYIGRCRCFCSRYFSIPFRRQCSSMEMQRNRRMQWMARLLRFLAYCIDGQQPVHLEPVDLEAFQEELVTFFRPAEPRPNVPPVLAVVHLPPPPCNRAFQSIGSEAEAPSTQAGHQVGRGTWPTFPDPSPESTVYVRRPDMLNRTGNFHLFRNCPAVLGMPSVLIPIQRQFAHYQTICQQCVIQTYVQRSLPGS